MNPARLGEQAIEERVGGFDWPAVESALDALGCAVLPGLLSEAQCDAIGSLWEDGEAFRSQVDMASHGYGRGAYRYFAYPLPQLVSELRATLYPRLVPTANRWLQISHKNTRFPKTLDAFLERCHRVGQSRPTPLLLDYGEGDYNRLHQDLYGEHVFPLQLAVLLSAPGADFAGGEFVLTEQRPRMQSRVEVVALARGDAVAFAVNERPVAGARGPHRVRMRHGVSRIRSGRRRTLGVIFHDAA